MDLQMSSSRVVIFTGGNLGDWALRLPQPGDYLIGADKGAFFLLEAGFTPDLAVGDFDTVTPEQLEAVRSGSRVFRGFDPIDKDYTDTELAFRIALERAPAQIVIAGGSEAVLTTRLPMCICFEPRVKRVLTPS
ncbi:thiamine pyrophosphokinase [Paenibacillus beijingensis]|uniref:thiamine pyrophosphokinase n=1 Tax=Paenibacillus beijingensis TaxID=1126833 RepID=UPI000B1319DB